MCEAFIAKHCILQANDEYLDQHFELSITIGKNCSFEEYCIVCAFNKMIIGDGFLTGRRVTITANAMAHFMQML